MMKYVVYYTDDWNKKHMTFVKSLSEIKIIKARFINVTYEVL